MAGVKELRVVAVGEQTPAVGAEAAADVGDLGALFERLRQVGEHDVIAARCEAHDAETVGKVLNTYLGAMTEADAKRRAFDIISNMHFGNNDYYLVWSMSPEVTSLASGAPGAS